MAKLKIDKLIIVEGKYDKIRLSNIVDANIIETGGFSVFKNKEIKNTLKHLAREHGAIILTDSDTAGYKIRVFLSKILGSENIINIMPPQIAGKEKRKQLPSAQGYVGIEGTDDKILIDLLEKYATDRQPQGDMTVSDLYAVGLVGVSGAKQRKNELLLSLGVQQNVSNNFLLGILNDRYTKQEFYKLFDKEYCDDK